MNQVFNMAIKDLKILFRDKMGAFFIVGFPILMGVFFGLIMGGSSNADRGAMKVAIVDQDDSTISHAFVAALQKNKSVELEPAELEDAKESVRKGQRVGLIVLSEGFGKTAGIFWQPAPEIQLGADPSRSAESGMLQGFIMEAIGSLAGERFQNPSELRPFVSDSLAELQTSPDVNPVSRQLLTTMFGSLDQMFESMEQLQQKDGVEVAGGADSGAKSGPSFEFAKITALDISRQVDPNSAAGQLKKIRSPWDISFPQAMMWGVLGCVAGFAISIANENTLGTMLRLQVAPVSRFQILAGKALACFITVVGVITMLTVLGVLLGMQPTNYLLLLVAAGCVAFCFVGIMMTMSVLGKTERSVSGSGWAINMVMAMLGGCMIPVMFMPKFMQTFSVISPIKWGILALEGAIWRDFSWSELGGPCGVLIAFGTVGLIVGTLILSRRD